MRESILAINNDKDLNDYVSAHYKQLPQRAGEPKYERNPVGDNLATPHLAYRELTRGTC